MTRLKQAQDYLSPLEELSSDYAGCRGFEAIPEDSSMEHSTNIKENQKSSLLSIRPDDKPSLISSVYQAMGKIASEPPGQSKNQSVS